MVGNRHEKDARPLYPLPKDTAATAVLRGELAVCLNLGLRFDRFTPFGPDWSLEGPAKKRALDNLVQVGNSAGKDPGYRDLVRQHYRRWREMVRAGGALNDCVFEAGPEWRMAVGLGRGGVLETGFAFHHVYGFPYLPGSALKGLTRSYVLWVVAGNLGVPYTVPGEPRPGRTPLQYLEAILTEPDESERRAALERLQDSPGLPEDAVVRTAEAVRLLAEHKFDGSPSLSVSQCIRVYRDVFGASGHKGRRGSVVFFDAVPVEPPVLKVDVMNPHYGEYYRGAEAPADYLSPVPVYFLAVEAGSRFAFAVGGADEELARKAKSWLVSALRDFGAGAKTSAGYGYFSFPSPGVRK
ncbi:MAG: type III-B CRISPR module RAMP protein Cmr6 [Bacillota bacterium]|nr:type III-B CRISPR module RAMP protein Cmr6 [Bacillota bacterium]